MPAFTLSETQHTAIYRHDCNIAVSAGAGSGKTFILTNRFLALLEARPDWRLNQIVAITFTQKAAGEMRDRVRGLLLAKAAESGDVLWQARLNEMDSARIGTIHSLCASVLRANAAIAGIDPDFAVLDEAQALLMRENAVEDCLRDLSSMSGAVLALFDEYDPQLVVKTLGKKLNADMHELPPDLLERWGEDYEHAARQMLRQLAYSDVLADARDFGFEGIQGSDKLTELWQVCIAWMRGLSDNDLATGLNALHALSQTKIGNIGTGGVWGDAKSYRGILSRAITLCKENFASLGEAPGEADARAAFLLEGWQYAITLAGAHYKRLKEAARALDFDDLESKTHQLLTDPAVAARYDGAEFQHLMVDEFQDTSAVQWDIVRNLASPERPGALFIVGDPKQSIYAFRGADPTTFEQAQEVIITNAGLSLSLDESFRSHQPLVGCFNATFARTLTRDELSPVARYQSTFGAAMHAHRLQAPCDDPAVEVLLYDKDRMPEADSEERRVWEARTIAHRIHDLVSSGRPCYDKALAVLRPLGYGDFAILFRSMTHVTLYESGLRDAGIPYVTLGGKSYYDRPEVWDVLHLLIALHNPNDGLALASALRSPMFGFSDETLLALRLSENGGSERLSLWNALMNGNKRIPQNDLETVNFARQTLQKLSAVSGRIGVAELMQFALDETGYLAVLTALPDGARRRMNVEKLLSLAMQPGAATQSISTFTRTVQSLTDLEVRESEAVVSVEGAVQIMSVHASKGLEFPVVIIADAANLGRQNNPDVLLCDPDLGWACKLQRADEHDEVPQSFAFRRAAYLESQREEAESRRLLYVASTRAQDLLIISGENKSAKTDWISLLRSALQIEATPTEDQGIEEFSFQGDWGEGRLVFPNYEETEPQISRRQADTPFSTNAGIMPEMPPLLAPLPSYQQHAQGVRATALAALSEYVLGDPSQRFYSRTRWRAENLQSGAHAVRRAVAEQGRISGVIIGELIHRALRWDTGAQLQPDLFDRLLSEAWELGLVREQDRIAAAQRAQTAIQMVRRSAVYQQVLAATRCFRELPFVLQLGRHTIHGTIDVVLQRSDGGWALIDYKTAAVPDHILPEEQAERDILQVSVYAHAAAELLVLDDIDVYIHYIRSNQTIEIDRSRWQQAFATIEQAIGDIISEDD